VNLASSWKSAKQQGPKTPQRCRGQKPAAGITVTVSGIYLPNEYSHCFQTDINPGHFGYKTTIVVRVRPKPRRRAHPSMHHLSLRRQCLGFTTRRGFSCAHHLSDCGGKDLNNQSRRRHPGKPAQRAGSCIDLSDKISITADLPSGQDAARLMGEKIKGEPGKQQGIPPEIP